MTAAFRRLRLIWVVVLGLLMATMGQTTASAERFDFGVSTLAANSGTALKTVTSWADAGITPDLNPGRWVQLGEATKTNFRKTGLPGPKVNISLEPPSVSVQGSKVPFTNSVTDEIPTSSLQWPPGLDKWRSLFGQRKIIGGGK